MERNQDLGDLTDILNQGLPKANPNSGLFPLHKAMKVLHCLRCFLLRATQRFFTELSLRWLYSRIEIPLAWARVVAVNVGKCDKSEIYLRDILNRIW